MNTFIKPGCILMALSADVLSIGCTPQLGSDKVAGAILRVMKKQC